MGYAGPASAAVTITRADLKNGELLLEGQAAPNATITVNGGPVSGQADASGRFKIQAAPFSSPTCVVTLSDGTTSTQSTLSGCTPSQPPPPPGPPAPGPLAPVNGASVVEPFSLSWSASSDPTGIVAYIWEVATSATFAAVVDRNSTAGTTTGVSGLIPGTYFWHVKAESGAFTFSDFSATASFTVTGTAAGTPATPTLTAPAPGAQYHPLESFPVAWTAAANAANYRVEMATDPGFALDTFLISPTVSGTSFTSPLFGFETPLFIRARGVALDGTLGLPSATVSAQITFLAPVPPPPNLLAPADGTTMSVPITFDWSDDPNPQLGGYELQIAADPTFPGGCGSIALCVTGITPSQYTLSSLSSGTKYWRVRSYHGASAPGVAAVTAFSAVRSLTVPVTAPSLLSLAIDVYAGGGTFLRSHTNVFSGTAGDNQAFGTVQLNGPAPAGGTVLTLSSSNASVASVPASLIVAAGVATASYRIEPLQVTASTTVSLSASLGAQSVSAPLTVDPPNIKQVDVGVGPPVPNIFSGGASEVGTVVFNGLAPTGSVIALSSSSVAVSVPPSVTVSQPLPASFTITTSQVTATTSATITATWKGQSVPISLTLHPPPTLLAPASGASFATGQAVTFDWNDLLGLSYEIQIAGTSDFAAPALDQQVFSVSQFTSSTLPSGTLFWRVRGIDVYGAPGPWSAVGSITVTAPAGPLPAPSLGFPAADARFAPGQTITFTWSTVAGAASYTLQVATSNTFSPLVLNQQVVATTQFSTSALPTATMWWRVRANDSAGNPGAWSAARRFEVK